MDPRLEEYIDDVKLVERWDSKVLPTPSNILARVLVSYEKIKDKAPGFRMNIDDVVGLGKSLNGWFSDSEITRQLERIRIMESRSSGRKFHGDRK